MTLSFLRPTILATLAVMSLASCGGKATFDINVQIQGLAHDGLVLVETKSGQTIIIKELTANDINLKSVSFANSIEYGTEFEVKVGKDPDHQECTPRGGTTGTAGQMASINAVFFCEMKKYTVGGTVTLVGTGSYKGLTLINGSNARNPISFVGTSATTYEFAGITFNTPYGITIFSQPEDKEVTCKLVPDKTLAGVTATDEKVAGTMADANVKIDVVCTVKRTAPT